MQEHSILDIEFLGFLWLLWFFEQFPFSSDGCSADSAVWRGEDSEADPAGRDGFSRRFVLLHTSCLHFCFEECFHWNFPLPNSLCKENLVHLDHNEGNMDWIGLQGSFCRYALILSFRHKYFRSLNCIQIMNVFFLPRFYAQSDQSGSSLCCYDQQLWVWKGLFSEGQPWPTALGNLKAAAVAPSLIIRNGQ